MAMQARWFREAQMMWRMGWYVGEGDMAWRSARYVVDARRLGMEKPKVDVAQNHRQSGVLP